MLLRTTTKNPAVSALLREARDNPTKKSAACTGCTHKFNNSVWVLPRKHAHEVHEHGAGRVGSHLLQLLLRGRYLLLPLPSRRQPGVHRLQLSVGRQGHVHVLRRLLAQRRARQGKARRAHSGRVSGGGMRTEGESAVSDAQQGGGGGAPSVFLRCFFRIEDSTEILRTGGCGILRRRRHSLSGQGM